MINSKTKPLHDIDSLNKILQELIHISNKDYVTFDDCLLAYIQFGMEKTGFSTGIVSRIKDGKYTVLQAISWKENFNKGVVIALCDTLCNTAYKTGKTLFCASTAKSKLYKLPARSYLNVEAIICTPLKVNGSIYGTLTFCSESEINNSAIWTFLTNLVELLGQSLSKIIKENILLERLAEEKKLLQMGSNLTKMASYKRCIKTNEVISTDNFYKIFEIEKKARGKLFSNHTLWIR